MGVLTDIILNAGRTALEICLYLLLPVMIVMLTVLRLLESKGVLDWIVKKLTPFLMPAGLTGLGIFAMLQVSFVSFAAPVATLAIMEHRNTSKRHIAATLAMVMAMAQANVTMPLAALGLKFGTTLLVSLLGGLVASATTYHFFGSSLDESEPKQNMKIDHQVAKDTKGVLDVINNAGAEAFRISIGALPMLLLSLLIITFLRKLGAIDALTGAIAPILEVFHIEHSIVLATMTKYLAGGTAMLAVMTEMLKQGGASVAMMNNSAGFLIHPLDIPGVAVLISAGPRVASVFRCAFLGAITGIFVRTVFQFLLS